MRSTKKQQRSNSEMDNNGINEAVQRLMAQVESLPPDSPENTKAASSSCGNNYDWLDSELSRVGIGKRFNRFKLNGMTWLSDEVMKSLRGYLYNIGQNVESGRGLVICGPYGVGKSAILAFVAMAILDYWKKNDLLGYRTAKYFTTYELCRICARDDDQYYKLKKTSLLLIDDFGAEYSHDWPLSTLNAIVDQRYMNQMPTCFATNISSARLANAGSDEFARYGRIIDRMNQAEDFLILEINAPSQRK